MRTLSERAYDHLLELIRDSRLSYQEIYSETKLSRELGISRTPFRDALQRLAQEGYIDILPSKGFCLHQLTRQDVVETFQVRSALECYCTVEITRNARTEKAQSLFRQLESLMQSMEEVLRTSHSIEDFCEYDFAFHLHIIDYMENAQFSAVFGSFIHRMKRLAYLSLAHEGRMEDTCREHRAILEGMKAGRAGEIYEITLRHMNVPQGINLEDL